MKEAESPACSLVVVRSGARHEPAEHDGKSDDHPERIGIEEAGLNAANDTRGPADESGRTTDDCAIDDCLVADLPEDLAEEAAARGQYVLVEPVEVVLVLEHDANRLEPGVDDA